MPATSTDPATLEIYHRAEAARLRRSAPGITFASLRACLLWYYEARDRLQVPTGMHPRTERVPSSTRGRGYRGDEAVLLQVDGGPGGDLDEVFATARTVQQSLEQAGRHHPRGVQGLYETVALGRSQASVADEWKLSQQAVSQDIGRAMSFLTGALSVAGVLR